MKEFEIEFHFRFGNDQKDHDVEKIIANSYLEAIDKLITKYERRMWIFKTVMKSVKTI